jgi:hypothetical protein
MKLKLFLQEEVCFYFKNKLCYFNIRTILKISFNLPPLILRNKLVGEINCFMDFNFQGSPLPLLLDNDASSLMDYGVGNDSVILVDEDSWLKYPKKLWTVLWCNLYTVLVSAINLIWQYEFVMKNVFCWVGRKIFVKFIIWTSYFWDFDALYDGNYFLPNARLLFFTQCLLCIRFRLCTILCATTIFSWILLKHYVCVRVAHASTPLLHLACIVIN